MIPKVTNFLAPLVVGGVSVAALGTVPLGLLVGCDAVASWWIGAGVSLANCLWGTLWIAWAVGRSHSALLAAVGGGFFARLVLAGSAFYLLWGRAGIDGVVLALSIVGFYFVGMVLEIRFLEKHVLRTHPSRRREAGSPGA